MITFVTGTDTDVGKTVATAALVVRARESGRSVYVIKPAQTGVEDREPGDLDAVRALLDGAEGEEGVRLTEPLAPDVAARRAGLVLPTLDEQASRVLDAASRFDDVLVEGAGGVRVRLGDFDLLDLAARCGQAGHDVAFVVVARAGLGTLNHSLLTVDAIRTRGLDVAGLIIGAMPATPDIAESSNLEELPRICRTPLLAVLPEGLGALTPDDFARAVAPLFA